MKKLFAIFVCILFITAFGAPFAFAEGQTANTPISTVTSASTVSSYTTNSVVNAVSGQNIPSSGSNSNISPAVSGGQSSAVSGQVSVAPDSLLYFLKTLIENIRVTLTFSPDNKAELLVGLAGKRLAEANLMVEKNKEQLVKKVMKAYIQTVNNANEQIKEAVGNGKDVKGVLDDIRIVELSADKLIIKATGIVPKDSAAEMQTAVTDTIKETLALQAFVQAKADFFEAKGAVKQARMELKVANESGDEAKVKAAQDKLNKAQQYMEQMDKAKDYIEAFKDQIEKEAKAQENIKDKKDEKDEKDEDKDGENKATSVEKLEKKAEMKAEKLKDQLGKQVEKMDKLEEKAKDKFKKARARIEKKEDKNNRRVIGKKDKHDIEDNDDRESEEEND